MPTQKSTRPRQPAKKPTAARTTKKAPDSDRPEAKPATDFGDLAVFRLVRQVRDWTDSLLSITGAATGLSINLAKRVATRPGQKEALAKAGGLLRAARETAGFSIEELGKAIDLKDPALLELVENGKTALPFEIILRLTSVLGRNDPVSFLLNLTRTYNPQLWKTLEDLGVGRLVLQVGREREFANIYRACDEARQLDDESFARVLAFVKSGFDLAMTAQSKGGLAAAPTEAPAAAKPRAPRRKPAAGSKPSATPRKAASRRKTPA